MSSATTARQAAQCRPSCLKIFVMRGFSFQIGFHSGVLGLDGGEQSVLYGVGLRQLLRGQPRMMRAK